MTIDINRKALNFCQSDKIIKYKEVGKYGFIQLYKRRNNFYYFYFGNYSTYPEGFEIVSQTEAELFLKTGEIKMNDKRCKLLCIEVVNV